MSQKRFNKRNRRIAHDVHHRPATNSYRPERDVACGATGVPYGMVATGRNTTVIELGRRVVVGVECDRLESYEILPEGRHDAFLTAKERREVSDRIASQQEGRAAYDEKYANSRNAKIHHRAVNRINDQKRLGVITPAEAIKQLRELEISTALVSPTA